MKTQTYKKRLTLVAIGAVCSIAAGVAVYEYQKWREYKKPTSEKVKESFKKVIGKFKKPKGE